MCNVRNKEGLAGNSARNESSARAEAWRATRGELHGDVKLLHSF